MAILRKVIALEQFASSLCVNVGKAANRQVCVDLPFHVVHRLEVLKPFRTREGVFVR